MLLPSFVPSGSALGACARDWLGFLWLVNALLLAIVNLRCVMIHCRLIVVFERSLQYVRAFAHRNVLETLFV